MDLDDRIILLGITGGVAAYKACELARRLQDQGARVQAILTRGAMHFVTPALLHAITGRPAYTGLWDERFDQGMGHITLSRDADALLVAPATAHFIAKLAHGLSDDLLSTLALARQRERCRLLVAPAMNVEMWEHPATERNVRAIEADGAVILGPGVGDQACGEVGSGRLLEPLEIVEEVIAAFQFKCLQGRRVLVTAGPTFEAIDPVRAITNRSSGKMGYAIARAAREAGADVTLVSGPTALAAPRGVRRLDVTTARQMHEAVMAQAGGADVFVAVAAVADWRAERPVAAKMKKSAASEPLTIRFVPNPDILAEVAALPSPPFCVGFAAESEHLVENARAKLAAKKLPLVIANRAQDAIGADDSELLLIDERASVTLPRASKLQQARRIVADIAARLG
ncbi:MAG TPA: bifunctional phosphopantothenoylcysteine decarboxylase/phosphopantothenate--cysteine ligase CoaBC [Burkholderiaceae bacterium]|jgi:phosphopantothenoylcysteine decarboxylase/phosphopantothenate--cysteine ligase|nr:bifunctional phosphopantothenoylcysteine decarboxylase/phosphopantothenate--cysteine ligase CoaBC [Burkholderiaceae bacterium]